MVAADSELPPQSQLPLDGSSFVGRHHELAELQQRFAAGERLVTLVGAPGIGKTRLALRYAEQIDQALFVDLSSAETLADVCGSLGSRLGILFSDDTDLVEHLGRAFSARGPSLCVLDNFEQLLNQAAGALERWLAAAPELQLLVTSRERLKVPGESLLDLSPLPLPEEDADVEQVADAQAVQLLLDRAPRLRLTSSNSQTLVKLVRELDGLPLAIELAAARLGVMDPVQLLARLGQRLDLLSRSDPSTGPSSDSSRRRATLRAALDWSWEALTEAEQRALSAASVFRGGFSLEAFEGIAGADLGASTHPLDVLQSLCEKSLIRTITAADRQLSTRFMLFESVRAYAADQLKDGGATTRRHAQYFTAACGERLKELEGNSERPGTKAEDFVALEWLAAELNNILLAGETLITSTSSADIQQRLYLALGAGAVLSRRGPPARYLSLIEAAIHHASYIAAPPALVARAELERARMLQRLGRMAEARDGLQSALDRLAETQDAQLLADLKTELGVLEQASGNLDAAEQAFRSALELLEPAQRGARARALAGLGLLRHSQGRLDEAFAGYDAALVLAKGAGAHALEASLCRDLGTLRMQQRRFEEAREYFKRALDLHRTHDAESLSDGTLVGIIEGNLGILEQELGQFEAAAKHFRRGLRAVRRAGSLLLEGHLLGYFGALRHERARQLGDTEEIDSAREHYKSSLLILRGIGDRRQEGVFSAALGALEAEQGRLAAAREAFSSATEVLEPLGDAGLVLALELHRAHLDLALARDAKPKEQAALRASADSRLAAALAPQHTTLLSQSDDARFALRLLQLSLSHDAVVFRGESGLLDLPGSEQMDLSARQPLRRIVAALIEQRLTGPGVSLSQDQLIEAGWPGERMTPFAAQNRLKVALSTLRKLGLRELLLRDEQGYLLDPGVPARIEA
ncbi:MAG: tetratricopeptide repeat protein [Polyangiaceae bacterium]|nr:tetratricopeptide repeat protein [Polyangiaceae bacterium]